MWLGDGFLSSFSKDNNANFLVKKKCNEAFRGDYTRTNFKSNLILVAVLRTISFFPDVSQALSNMQDVTCRSKSIIGKLVDKSIALDNCR